MQEHFNIIDVPGIFEKTTQGLTTKFNINMIKSMVYIYIQNSRSVMLVIIPANINITIQEILKIAKEINSNEYKTLKILTKLNFVDKNAEPTVVDLIKGRKYKLSLR